MARYWFSYSKFSKYVWKHFVQPKLRDWMPWRDKENVTVPGETCWCLGKDSCVCGRCANWLSVTLQTDLMCDSTYSGAIITPLTPNDHYSGRTAPLTSKRCILYIYSTNIGTEYFKHGVYSPFLPLQNAVCFIILTYLVPILFTFCIQGVLKLQKIPAPKG